MNDLATPDLLATYWGKAAPEMTLRGPSHHTVLGHSLDVAACAFVLVEQNPILLRQLSAHTGVSSDQVAVTFAAVCAIHDVGKLDTRFQRKAPDIANVLRPHSEVATRTKYDHGAQGFVQIEDDESASELLLQRLGGGGLLLLRAVCGHHGEFPARAEPDPRTDLPVALRREDEMARSAFIGCVLDHFLALGASLPWPGLIDGALVQRLGGLCAIADWLGSNVDHFPYVSGPLNNLTEYWEGAYRRALSACEDSGLVRASAVPRSFSELFPGYSPRDVQILTENVPVQVPGLVIVEAEMGKGKTEAALSVAARFLEAGLADGLTVALPTMATSNAMFGRIEALTPNLFPGAQVQIALAHGRASRNPQMRALIARGLVAKDLDAPEATVSCARWLLKKKRILLAQVGVGTIDQALQAALVVRHQFVRMFGLSRNVIVIDEVHAYDAYMEVLLDHLVSWLGALNVPVLLLSATLPSQRRAALARAWQGASLDEAEAGLGFESAISAPYPLVTVATKSSTKTFSREPATSRTIEVERWAQTDDATADMARVASRLVAAARAGARVVWIRNTVGEAQRAFAAVSAIAQGVEHVLFHARFRGCDRSLVEGDVLDRFGKSAPGGGRVLVATQVVEQSLDLDFDELHTDLAPIDLLFQRAGRLHRHQRSRLSGFEQPRMIVHAPSDAGIERLRFGPSQYVYDVGTLWIADRAVRCRSTFQFPGDLRLLVEETYHPDSRASLFSSRPALREAEDKRHHELEARRTNARRCCIPTSSAEPDGGTMLDDDDDAVQAFTRDGRSATLLPFVWDHGEARAIGTDRAAAWNLEPSRDEAWRLTSELLDQTLSLPARAQVQGAVEAGDEIAWREWLKKFRRFAEETNLGNRIVPVPMKRASDGYKGWLLVAGTRKRVRYSKTMGLQMPRKNDEAEAR